MVVIFVNIVNILHFCTFRIAKMYLQLEFKPKTKFSSVFNFYKTLKELHQRLLPCTSQAIFLSKDLSTLRFLCS